MPPLLVVRIVPDTEAQGAAAAGEIARFIKLTYSEGYDPCQPIKKKAAPKKRKADESVDAPVADVDVEGVCAKTNSIASPRKKISFSDADVDGVCAKKMLAYFCMACIKLMACINVCPFGVFCILHCVANAAMYKNGSLKKLKVTELKVGLCLACCLALWFGWFRSPMDYGAPSQTPTIPCHAIAHLLRPLPYLP